MRLVVLCPLACSSPPPESLVLCSPIPPRAPLVSMRLCRTALAASCRYLRALGPYGTLGRYCSGQRPCGACGPHVPGLLGLCYCVPVDNVPKDYACGRSSDVAFLSVARGAGGLVDVRLARLPASPFMDSASDLIRTRGEGLLAGLWGFARLAVQCVGLLWLCSGRTRAVGPTCQRQGSYRCVRLRLNSALTFGPYKGVPFPKGMLEENCAVVCSPLHCLALGHAAAGFGCSGRTVWRVQSRIAFSAPPGRNLPDQRM